MVRRVLYERHKTRNVGTQEWQRLFTHCWYI